jgi:hypothetical protein
MIHLISQLHLQRLYLNTTLLDTDTSAIQSALKIALRRQLVHAPPNGPIALEVQLKGSAWRNSHFKGNDSAVIPILSATNIVIVSSGYLSEYRHPIPLIGQTGNALSNSASSVACSSPPCVYLAVALQWSCLLAAVLRLWRHVRL